MKDRGMKVQSRDHHGFGNPVNATATLIGSPVTPGTVEGTGSNIFGLRVTDCMLRRGSKQAVSAVWSIRRAVATWLGTVRRRRWPDGRLWKLKFLTHLTSQFEADAIIFVPTEFAAVVQ